MSWGWASLGRCGLGVFGAAWVSCLFPGVVAASCLVVGLRGLFGVSWPFSGVLWASVSAGWLFVVSCYRSRLQRFILLISFSDTLLMVSIFLF